MKASPAHSRSGRHRNRLGLLLACLLILLSTGWPPAATAADATAADATDTEQPATAAGQPAATSPNQELAGSASLGLAIVKAFGALAVVIGLLLLLAAGIRKLGLTGQAGRGTGIITVLDTKMIAPKKYVAVIDIAGQPVAVGITDQQITMLARLEDTETIEALAHARRPAPDTASRFASLLDRARGKTATPTNQDQP